MDTRLQDLIIAPIITGVIASLIFLLLLSMVRPKLKISSKIAKLPNGIYHEKIDGNDGSIYLIKVLNKSRWSATNIQARLSLVRTITIQGGNTTTSNDFNLDKPSLFNIPGYRRGNPENSVFRFVTGDSLTNSWTVNTYVTFYISAKHSFSGFEKIFQKTYYIQTNDMQQGMFEHGKSMNITALN